MFFEREENAVSKVRSLDEIQKAHDILDDLYFGDTPLALTPESKEPLGAVLECLCWILSHKGGEGFEEKLIDIELKLNILGIGYSPKEEKKENKPSGIKLN